MPLSRVGGEPAKAGPEEAHRPQPERPDSGDGDRAERPGDHPPSVPVLCAVARRRLRLQWAGAIALLGAVLLAFLVPARTVHVLVDGGVTTVESRSSNDIAVVRQAGVKLEPGDSVESVGDEDKLAVRRATEAVLRVDGKTFALRTQAETIEQALVEAGVDLGAQDSVLRNEVFVSSVAPVAPPTPLAVLLGGAGNAAGEAASPGSVDIEVRRAVPFTVVENGQELALRSSRETVATALRDVGVRLGPGDEVQPTLDTEMTAGLEVHVEHATQVIVTLPNAKTVLYTLAGTVGEALAAGGVELPADYRLEPPAETPISEGLVIHVVGISAEDVLETERIESKTLYEPDSSLSYGERRIEQGQDGVHYRQYRLVYENGELVSRELAAEWDDPPAVDTVVYYSTADAPSVASPSVDAPPDIGNVVGVLTVYATWYNPASAGRSPSDPSYGITATGIPVDRGVCAVDPSVIPLGTRFYVPGYGYCLAADTGGGIRGEMIDLGYPDGVVPDWTSHWVDIYILGP